MNELADQTSATTGLSVGHSDLRRQALQLISVHKPDFAQSGNLRIVALVLRLAGAGLLAWVGYIHWYLWHLGYQHIPTDGPFFLLDGIAGVALAVLLLAWPRPVVGLLSAGFVASTILGLLVSLTVGLFGFKESIHASYVVQALVLESIAVIVLLAWTVIAARATPR